MGTKSVNADPDLVQKIVAHSKAQGVDPNTALAIALQETNLKWGEDGNPGHVLGKYWDTVPKNKMSSDDESVYAMVSVLKDKMAYAKQLGYDKKGEANVLQSYEGYGKLYPSTEGSNIPSFYEIPVSKDKPLDLSQNPAYGKTVISLRDDLIKKNPAIQQIVQNTPAFDISQAKPDSTLTTPNGTVLKIKKPS